MISKTWLCCVQLSLGGSFSEYISFDKSNRRVGLLLSTKEAIELISLKISDIPKALFLGKIGSPSFHPSTYLQLVVFFLYKIGYKKGGAMIMKEAK